MFKKAKKYGIIFTILSLSIFLYSCTDSTRKITLSENTQSEILVEENEVNEAISNAKKLLADDEYDEAKAYFNKAISLDKSNKDLYLEIKDIYMESNKFDDAYFIIKTAIANGVDSENMKTISKEISSKFDLIKLTNSVYQDSEYNLPQSVTTDINGESISLPLTWNISKVNTKNTGAFTYYGFNEEYGRQVEMNLTVLENVYDKQIGSINKIYTSNGKTYIDVDLVEFYSGEDSVKEAIKDNRAAINENGEYFLPNLYYIRNNYNKITTYEISNDCTFQLFGFDFDPERPGLPEYVSYETFENYINKHLTFYYRSRLFWIELKNESAYSIYRQFTP